MGPMGCLWHKCIARPPWITGIQLNRLVTSPQKWYCVHNMFVHCICCESLKLWRKIPPSSHPECFTRFFFRNLRKANVLRNSTGTASMESKGGVRKDIVWFLLKNTLLWTNASYIVWKILSDMPVSVKSSFGKGNNSAGNQVTNYFKQWSSFLIYPT